MKYVLLNRTIDWNPGSVKSYRHENRYTSMLFYDK